MTFPTIPTVGATRVLSVLATNPAGTHTSPSLTTLVNNSGDLLIAIVILYDGNSTNAEFSAWGGGFTEFGDFAGTATMAIGAAYKFSNGTETGTFTVTSADASANDSVFFLLSIPGAHPSTPPESGGFATGTAPDSGALNPAGWGAEDTLWIAVGGSGEDATTGSYTGIGTAPTNYTDQADSGISADAAGGVEGSVAFRQLNAASEDPGTWSMDTSNARGSSLIIAVRPDNSVTGTGALTIDEATLSATGVMHASGTGAPIIDEATLSATGVMHASGTGAPIIDEATLSATGSEVFTGTGALTIDEAALDATGVMHASGTGDLIIDEAAVAGVGDVTGGADPTGTGALTIDEATLSATGVMHASGTGAPIIDEATLSATGSEGFTGTGAPSIDEATLSAAGSEGFTGTGALTIDEVSFAGSGVSAPPVSGSGGVLILEFQISSSGSVSVGLTGTATLTLDEAILGGVGQVPIAIWGSALERVSGMPRFKRSGLLRVH